VIIADTNRVSVPNRKPKLGPNTNPPRISKKKIGDAPAKLGSRRRLAFRAVRMASRARPLLLSSCPWAAVSAMNRAAPASSEKTSRLSAPLPHSGQRNATAPNATVASSGSEE